MQENIGARDRYDGGRGIDTLVLEFTRDQWLSAAVQADIAAFDEFIANNPRRWSNETNSRDFHFSAFDLTVEEFENIRVIVDGVEIDPTNVGVTALDDAFGLGEDDPATTFAGSVLDNDTAPNLVGSIVLVTPPAKGLLTLNADGTFEFDTNGAFESLGAGQSEDVIFTYEVTDADGDTDQASVTITVQGVNDAAAISGDTVGDVTEDAGAVLSTSGTLVVTDVDAGEAVFNAEVLSGQFGDLSIASDGAWIYSADNTQSDIQEKPIPSE